MELYWGNRDLMLVVENEERDGWATEPERLCITFSCQFIVYSHVSLRYTEIENAGMFFVLSSFWTHGSSVLIRTASSWRQF